MSRPDSFRNLIEQRLARLRGLLPELGVDGIFISRPENRAYLSGFTGSAGVLLITLGHALIATDSRYFEQVGRECASFELVRVKGELSELLAGMFHGAGISRLAFEADHATVADLAAWKDVTPEVAWQPTRRVVAGLRAIKDDVEIGALRRAIALTDEALAAALAEATPGMSEKQLAWGIESYMRTHGADNVAFELIVAGGPNSALRTRPSDAALQAGEPIVIDIGAEVDGYHGDLTRTVCFGEPNDPARFWAIYNTVLRAQVTAEAGIRPDMTSRDADALAREVIAGAGYGDHFGHGLGHGVGLEIHESPLLSRSSTETVRAGMLITIEPGIYVPGWGGVRIEDVVLITENGAEVLTRAPKNPIL